MKLSIRIPYYNTYELTNRLIEGLLPQLTNETEVILVDDGCFEKRFISNIPYIKVIHQDNGGVSKARNTGIQEAKGKYIAFIDSDDMVTMDYVSQLLKLIDNIQDDIIVFNICKISLHIY